MERRRLGRTRHDSSIAVLSSAALADCTPEQAAKTFDQARRAGVNHVDIRSTDGEAEGLLAPLVSEHRETLFVAAGTDVADPDDLKRQVDDTLGTLGIDELDLYQLHGIASAADVDARTDAFGAADAARQAGLVGFVGVGAEGRDAPSALLHALSTWDVDTVMLPLNARLWSLPEYRADVNSLLSECRARAIGVQVTDVIARSSRRHHTDPARIKDAVDFAMSIPGVSCLLTPDDRMLVPLVVAAADRPSFLSDRRRKAIVASFASDDAIFGPSATGPTA